MNTATASNIAPEAPGLTAWNLALRFCLELAALVGLGLAGWRLANGPFRLGAVMIIPLAAAMAWGTFNVVGDPSRSGSAPVEVPGWFRLTLEIAILTAGVAAFVVAGEPEVGVGFAGLLALHYIASGRRLRWLLAQ